MNQVLHIFRKDTRHFWPEILISIVMLALYVAHSPSAWLAYSDRSRQLMLQQLTGLLGFLTPVSWLLLIARVTHAESLVGDNEFWLTRPYERSSLLAAKALFFATWICLPYLIAQTLILVMAGFHPLSYMALLFGDLLFVSAVLLLPLFAIATVNISFARMTLTLLGILFLFIVFIFFVAKYAVIIGVISTLAANSHQEAFYIPFVLFCVSAAAVIIQYKSRRVWISRCVLMTTPILVLAVGYASSRSSQIDRVYQPGKASTPPVLVDLATDADNPIKTHQSNGESFIDVSVQYSGVPEGYIVRGDSVKFTLATANGQQWTSPWEGRFDQILPGVRTATLSIPLPRAVYVRFQSTPITLHVTFALTQLKSDTATVMKYPSSEVSVPGVGLCTPEPDRSNTLTCRSVNSQPRLTLISTLWSDVPCSDSLQSNEASSLAQVWTEFYAGLPEAAITPVFTRNLWFSRTNNSSANLHGQAQAGQLCPGAPLTITQYHVVDRTQSDFIFPYFQLPAIAFKN